MEDRIKLVKTASELPDGWDDIADVYFQKREFLLHAEKYNPCGLRYYLLYQDDKPAAGAIVYTITINLLTYFKNLKSPVKFNIIGPPASVSCSGLTGGRRPVEILIKRILEKESGLVLGLNTETEYTVDNIIYMKTLPTVAMSHNFNSWDDYHKSLRSDYRRRLNRMLEEFSNVETIESGCSRYNDEMHDLYLQIMERTPTKLEILSMEFFKNLPGCFRLTTYSHNGRILCWHINLKDDRRLVFFFGGINYKYNREYNAYLNNLAGIIRESIEAGCKMIDFGQTAEIAKTRMGGVVINKNMFIYHKSRLLRGIFYAARGLLEYKREMADPNVFKKNICVNNLLNKGESYENIINSSTAV